MQILDFQKFALRNQNLQKEKWQRSQNLDLNPTCDHVQNQRNVLVSHSHKTHTLEFCS